MVSALELIHLHTHYEEVIEWFDLIVPMDHTPCTPWGWLPNACLGIDPERAWRTQLIDIARPGDRLYEGAWDVLIITGPRKYSETEAVVNDLILDDLESDLREDKDDALEGASYQPVAIADKQESF